MSGLAAAVPGASPVTPSPPSPSHLPPHPHRTFHPNPWAARDTGTTAGLGATHLALIALGQVEMAGPPPLWDRRAGDLQSTKCLETLRDRSRCSLPGHQNSMFSALPLLPSPECCLAQLFQPVPHMLCQSSQENEKENNCREAMRICPT